MRRKQRVDLTKLDEAGRSGSVSRPFGSSPASFPAQPAQQPQMPPNQYGNEPQMRVYSNYSAPGYRQPPRHAVKNDVGTADVRAPRDLRRAFMIAYRVILLLVVLFLLGYLIYFIVSIV